jgi:DNA-binding transcriptional regulator YiaG
MERNPIAELFRSPGMEEKQNAETAYEKIESQTISQVRSVVPPKRYRKGRGGMSAAELKTSLQQLNWSQQKFAHYSCVSLSAVKKWAQGRTRIPGPVAVLLHVLLEKHCP